MARRSSIERASQKADPDYLEQCNVRLPMRLIVALDAVADIEKELHPDEPKKPRGHYIAEAVETFLAEHRLADGVQGLVDIHFRHRQEYLDRFSSDLAQEQTVAASKE